MAKKQAAIIIFILCLFSASAFAHSASEGKGKFTKHFNESLFKITDHGEFSLEILLDEKEYKIGKDVIGIVVHDKDDGDVEGANIKINYEGMTEPPVIKEKGDGLYTAARLNLTKEGKWELKITIKKKKITDSAIFIFPDVLDKRLPAGKY